VNHNGSPVTEEKTMDIFVVQNALTDLREINDNYDGDFDDELQDELNELVEQCKEFVETHDKGNE